MKRTFEDWMQAVDHAIEARTGFTSADLADVCYMDWFEDGTSPASAARRAIRNMDE
mgnify:CR=1 FL=1